MVIIYQMPGANQASHVYHIKIQMWFIHNHLGLIVEPMRVEGPVMPRGGRAC